MALDEIESALYVPDPRFAYLIILDERTLSCDLETATGSGEHLGFFFCAPPAEGDEYTFVDLDQLGEKACPGPFTSGNLEEESGSDLAGTLSGSMTISAADGCVTGSFSATFEGGGELEGSFSAFRCEVP